MEPLYIAISIILSFMTGCVFMFVLMRMYVNQWRGMVNKLLLINKIPSEEVSLISVYPNKEDHLPPGYEDVT